MSLLGRLLSMEAALFLMGVVSLVYGVFNGVEVNIFFGAIIIPGVFLLAKVQKKDWKKHWDELEAEQQKRAGNGRSSSSGKEKGEGK